MPRMPVRGPGLLAVIAALAAGAAGCGGGDAGAGAAGTESVRLEVSHRSEWRQLWVEGSTDLPDGAYVNYRVAHELGETTPPADWPAVNLLETGRAAVMDGQFWTRINTFNWPPGAVRIIVQFPLPPQPPEVTARYGAFGEQLTGDNVTAHDGLKAVEVEHVFEHRR